jgi:hypothetical protein
MDENLDFATMSAYDLINALDAGYPHECIKLGQTTESAHRDAGRRELIDNLVLAMRAELKTGEDS